MNSQEYWEKREHEAQKKYIKEEQEYIRDLRRYYDSAMDAAQKEIDSFYAKYAGKEGITLAEAKRRVSRLDIEEYGRKAAKYVKNKNLSRQASEEMRLYNLTMKVNRLEMLKSMIGLEMVAATDEIQKYCDEKLTQRAMDEFERQAGILGKSVGDPKGNAKSIVGASFHNANFSTRIWGQQSEMKSQLSMLLQRGMIQGKSSRQLAPELRKLFGVKKYEAERLMRTELTRVRTAAQKQSFEENGFDRYMYINFSSAPYTKSPVCEICKEVGKKCEKEKGFLVKDMMPGENAPPMHPGCRCSVAAYMDREEFDKWLNEESKKDAVLDGTKSPKALKNQAENGIINIKMDKFVPCLEDAKTGEILNTESKRIANKHELKGCTEKNGWYINWAKEIDAGRQVYGLYLKGDDKLQGLCAFDIDKQNYAVRGNWIVAAPHNRGKNKQYNGVGGHLFAIMGQRSVEAGYGGFFYGKAANKKLLEHYKKTVGAEEFPGVDYYTFAINEAEMKKILDKYNFEWRK